MKPWQQKKANNLRCLKCLTEEARNDKESLPDLFYGENQSDFELKEDNSEYNSEEDKDLDEAINKMSS